VVIKDINSLKVKDYFGLMGSLNASTYALDAPHPNDMERTKTLDFCHILEGEIVLVLDNREAHLNAGDTVI
jgi:hypothetical protein